MALSSLNNETINMYRSQGSNGSKKPFQKPNILRKKVWPKPKQTVASDKASVSISQKQLEDSDDFCGKILFSSKAILPKNYLNVFPTEKNKCVDKEGTLVGRCTESLLIENVVAASQSSDLKNDGVYIDIDKTFEQNTLNIESFINDASSNKNCLQNDVNSQASCTLQQEKTKWCLDLSPRNMDYVLSESNTEQTCKVENVTSVLPTTKTLDTQKINYSQQKIPGKTPQSIAMDCFTSRAVRLKCDEPNCNKGFWSEETLKKHKNAHNRKATTRTVTQTRIECPVKKVNADGTEDKCESIFDARPDLLKHLNTDHKPEDASYRCEVCGRRFFWASGLRAHAASVCARGGLVCGWPGCGRVFRLPCRLREHARAHTGDRPYLCSYPECGWAFRSASKLVRHARRHTDERRHACSACGRAFLRREHLREHAERHHAPHARPTHACHHHGCGQSFTNMSSLYMHMKKVHRKQADDETTAAVAEISSMNNEAEQNVFWVSLVPKAEASDEQSLTLGSTDPAATEAIGDPDSAMGAAGVEDVTGVEVVEGVAEGHSARTHCTWPLQREVRTLLDDDAQVDQTDGSVYTIRSDLFLHGNAPIDEDSTNIGGEGIASTTPLDADLCLIDSHPTIDLMQEELMYDDSAVDEASFRVFLLNGDELT